VNKLLAEGSEEESGGGSDVHQRGGYVLSLPQMKRLHRQSTVSCDGNFATGLTPSGAGGNGGHMPERIPESQILCSSEMPPPPPDPIRMKGPESPNRRKTSSKNGSHNLMEHQELVQQHPATIQQHPAENNPDESVGSFISSLRSQLKPINEWTSKWHCDLMKANNSPSALASSSTSPGGGGAVSHVETSSRNSLSVPSTPNQHQTFTFDEFPGKTGDSFFLFGCWAGRLAGPVMITTDTIFFFLFWPSIFLFSAFLKNNVRPFFCIFV
jgi:hypothetical protein